MVEIVLDRLTKYEKARIIGSRALQLSMGAPMLLKLSKKELEDINFNPLEIAKLEFKENKIPMEIKRTLPHERLKVLDKTFK